MRNKDNTHARMRKNFQAVLTQKRKILFPMRMGVFYWKNHGAIREIEMEATMRCVYGTIA